MSSNAPFGLLLVDKPVGPTSHDIVDVVRKAFGIRRVGHTGTLDPFASGLLVMCLGPATRLAEFLVGLDKEYTASGVLGVETDTFDHTGTVLSRDTAWRDLDRSSVEAALQGLTGEREQLPPRYSAVKVGGVPAHRRVRRGESVELETRRVRIDRLRLSRWEPPELDVDVHCSSGTYIRSLAHELGERLGTGCHLRGLRRTAVGSLIVSDAATLEQVKAGTTPRTAWIDPARALSHLPVHRIDEEESRRIRSGQPVQHAAPDAEVSAVVDADGWLVAVARVESGVMRPRKVFPRDP